MRGEGGIKPGAPGVVECFPGVMRENTRVGRKSDRGNPWSQGKVRGGAGQLRCKLSEVPQTVGWQQRQAGEC